MNTYQVEIGKIHCKIEIIENGEWKMTVYQTMSEAYDTIEELEYWGYHPKNCLEEVGYIRKMRSICQCGRKLDNPRGVWK